MRASITLLVSLLLAGACYFAFSGDGAYHYEGSTADSTTTEPDTLTPLEEGAGLHETMLLADDPPVLAWYHCHNALCLHAWIATPGGMPCPECGCFVDDWDLIDDDELD